MPAPAAPKLFDVLPEAEMRRALRQSLPEGTKLVWQPAGKLDITGGTLGVGDAGSCDPRYIEGEFKTLDWPYGSAEVWLQLCEEPDGRFSRVFAVLILAPDEADRGVSPTCTGSWQIREAPAMAIDSATALVADYARLLTCCQLGGPKSGVCLGKGSVQGEDKAALERTAAWLDKQGFPNRIETWATGSISVYFEPGLTEEQAAAANALLGQHGIADEVRIFDAHTSRVISDALVKSLLTHVDDGTSPFLYAFSTGFGDGMYYWDALDCDGRLRGYLCNFVPDESELEGES